MSEIHRMSEDKIQEFFGMIDWSYVKRVEITKTVDGVIWASEGGSEMNFNSANENIAKLCDWIDECNTLQFIMPGYPNDAVIALLTNWMN